MSNSIFFLLPRPSQRVSLYNSYSKRWAYTYNFFVNSVSKCSQRLDLAKLNATPYMGAIHCLRGLTFIKHKCLLEKLRCILLKKNYKIFATEIQNKTDETIYLVRFKLQFNNEKIWKLISRYMPFKANNFGKHIQFESILC